MAATKAGQALRGTRADVGPRTFQSYSAIPAAVLAPAIVAALALAWTAAYLAGGSRTVFPHLFYVPIMMTAVRFGPLCSVTAAVGAGLLCGPFLPAEVATGLPQDASSWLVRLCIFVAVALLLTWLTGHTRPGLVRMGVDAKVAATLRRALRSGELVVYYQPQVDLDSRKVVGLEALVRWVHPRKGLISAAEFIPAAERTGMVSAIDRFVLDEASRQLAAWSAAGLDELTMAVNVSAHRFLDADLVDDTALALRSNRLDPGRLHLEVTETAIIADVEQAADQISRLKQLGVKIAIDDFGAGQSSLSYLHQFTIDVIKIDRGFVANVLEDARVGRLVAGMIRLFESVGVTVVGEGIDNAEQFVHMASMRCQVGQGYYFAHPASADEIGPWLEQARSRADRRSRSDRR